MNRFADLPVVVVEDDPVTSSLFKLLLTGLGFTRIAFFDDGRAAVDYIGSNSGALVLDLNIPGVPGMELLRHIHSTFPNIPVVVVTGRDQIETAIECMQLGAVDYLTKPFTVERFTNSIMRAVARLEPAETETAPRPAEIADVPERLSKAVSFMEENLSDQPYLETIARQACLSKYHFSREFKKHLGISPIQFMLHRRIARAKALLQAGKDPIAEVALQCGFSDQSEFTKWFKKASGATPSSFRNSLASKKPDIQQDFPN